VNIPSMVDIMVMVLFGYCVYRFQKEIDKDIW
jgi:hypothetical protein